MRETRSGQAGIGEVEWPIAKNVAARLAGIQALGAKVEQVETEEVVLPQVGVPVKTGKTWESTERHQILERLGV